MSKIWKSRFAMKLLCPAYKSDKPDPRRMEVFKALHEQVRLQHRMKMKTDGWRLLDSEVPIENDWLIGRIDDVFQSIDGEVSADEYVSSSVPAMYKYLDAAISACCLRDYYDIDVSASVVPRGGEATRVPEALIQAVRSMMMSEEFQRIFGLSDDELLEYANPASGICTYCANRECRRKTQ